MIVFYIFIVWYLIGYISFIYYWLADSDLTYSDAWSGIPFAMLGPIILLIGFIDTNENKVLIKKRK